MPRGGRILRMDRRTPWAELFFLSYGWKFPYERAGDVLQIGGESFLGPGKLPGTVKEHRCKGVPRRFGPGALVDLSTYQVCRPPKGKGTGPLAQEIGVRHRPVVWVRMRKRFQVQGTGLATRRKRKEKEPELDQGNS